VIDQRDTRKKAYKIEVGSHVVIKLKGIILKNKVEVEDM